LAAGLLDNNLGNPDLVVMDDFLYAEPVPEPTTVFVSAIALVGLLVYRWRGAPIGWITKRHA
jgi:hypothetical protein